MAICNPLTTATSHRGSTAFWGFFSFLLTHSLTLFLSLFIHSLTHSSSLSFFLSLLLSLFLLLPFLPSSSPPSSSSSSSSSSFTLRPPFANAPLPPTNGKTWLNLAAGMLMYWKSGSPAVHSYLQSIRTCSQFVPAVNSYLQSIRDWKQWGYSSFPGINGNAKFAGCFLHYSGRKGKNAGNVPKNGGESV